MWRHVHDSNLVPAMMSLSGLFFPNECSRKEPAPPAASAEVAPFVGPDTRVHPLGELGSAADYRMSVESVRDCPLDEAFAPKRGSVKVGLEVALEGVTAREVPANPFYGTLEDPAGNTYASTLAGCEPVLPAVRLTNGQKARGFITFEIPSGARKLTLRYAPIVIGPGKEELRFAIER